MRKIIEMDHLQKAGASWFRHCYMALYYSSLAILSGIFGIIHAFIPQLFGFLPYKLAKKITDGAEKNFSACLIDEEDTKWVVMMSLKKAYLT